MSWRDHWLSGNFTHRDGVKRTGSTASAALIWHRFEHLHSTGSEQETAMNRLTTIAVYMTLTAAPGLSAQAQPAAALQAPPQQTQRATEPVVRCTHQDNGFRAMQPCRARPAVEAPLLVQNVSRQEFECVLSGVCGVVDGSRVNG
jgi:hypothetical protein